MALVSIIIPTHNRAQYAVPTIHSLLSLSGEIEVVVCDTSEFDSISSHFEGHLQTGKLKLVRPNQPLSVVDNFNEALQAATGSYYVFIGDDDFVSSHIVSAASWALSNKVDALSFTFPVLYYWPDFHHRTQAGAIAGTLRISKFSGDMRKHDSKRAAADALDNLGGGVMEMPRAYVGLFSKALAQRIQKKWGPLFGGVSPDIYSAFLISLEAANNYQFDYPIVIPGSSGSSTAGQSANGQHVGGLRDNAHIGAFKNLIWDERIPEFYSVPTVWSYSLLKAYEKSGLNVLHGKTPNYARLYIKCLIYQRPYRQYTLAAIRTFTAKQGRLGLYLNMIVGLFRETQWIVGKLVDRLNSRVNANALAKIYEEVLDTRSASLKLEEYYLLTPPIWPELASKK